MDILNIQPVKESNSSYMLTAKAHPNLLAFYVPQPFNCSNRITATKFISSWQKENNNHDFSAKGVVVNLSFDGKHPPMVTTMYPIKQISNSVWQFKLYPLQRNTKINSTHYKNVRFMMIRRHSINNSELNTLIKKRCPTVIKP